MKNISFLKNKRKNKKIYKIKKLEKLKIINILTIVILGVAELSTGGTPAKKVDPQLLVKVKNQKRS